MNEIPDIRLHPAVIMNDLKWISLVILILINLILITCYSYVLMISLDC